MTAACARQIQAVALAAPASRPHELQLLSSEQ